MPEQKKERTGGAKLANHAPEAPISQNKRSLWQKLRGLISDFPTEERSSGIRAKTDREANDNKNATDSGKNATTGTPEEKGPVSGKTGSKRIVLSDDEQMAHVVDATLNGKFEESYALLLSGAFTNHESQMAIIQLIRKPEQAINVLRAGVVCPDAETELLAMIRTARERVISNVLSSGRFSKAKKIAVFLPNGAQEDKNTIILPYIMDKMMASGKEMASFQDPMKEVISYKVSNSGEITAKRMDNLDMYFPDLILLPAVDRSAVIPDLRLDDQVKFDPYSGEPLPAHGRYLIGVCFDYQIQESVGNGRYSAIVDEMVSEKRCLSSSRPPPGT